MLGNPKCRSKQRLSGGRAKHHDDPRADFLELCLEPGPARADLTRVRLAVDAAFAARFPLEVLDGVGDIDPRAIDPDVVEGVVQHTSGWADKGFTSAIFLVARLFADEHDQGVRRPFAENGLRAGPVQVAAMAAPGGSLEALERPLGFGWQKRRRVPGEVFLNRGHNLSIEPARYA